MSVPVELQKLQAEVSKYGDTPYLLTVSDDGRPHAVAVRVAWDGTSLVLEGGRKSVTNATARPAVTLLWPPVETGGFSLITDGQASVSGDRVSIHPDTAVLHRSLPDASGDDDGDDGSECVGVFRH